MEERSGSVKAVVVESCSCVLDVIIYDVKKNAKVGGILGGKGS